ncbi:MAG: iron-sulfur cluster assembly accessory protein [Gemmatimonadetes bacterium]|nr:iron-sulfur cluster assembly accessory protein [Gemmatimonadota bacterium]|tara:strand:+ start:671 stop:994 length:324 start_codon:yes stop_codon:yes gene_type:complete
MVTVTESAAGKIRDLLAREGRADCGLRVRVVGGGCSGLQYKLEFSEEPDGDIDVVESNGVRVFIDMKSALYLVGSELDFDDGLMGQGFKINNPNAKNQCGCGESFSV